jgi:hypothetical protein
MVVFTPPIQNTPVPNPITPYEYLDSRIDTISSQMDELMVHFALWPHLPHKHLQKLLLHQPLLSLLIFRLRPFDRFSNRLRMYKALPHQLRH